MSKTSSSLSITVVTQAPGADQPVFVEVMISEKVRNLISAARQQGLQVTEADDNLAVYLQDEDEDLDSDSSLEKAGIHKCPRIHIARRGLRIEVVVYFNGRAIEKQFGPGITINAIRKWAIREYNLTNSDTTDYDLALCDSESALDPAQHIGCLAQKQGRSLCLDLLVPPKILG